MTKTRVRPPEPEVLLRRRLHASPVRVPLRGLRVAEVAGAVPVRTVRSVHGMSHYAGRYWSATTRTHVVFESRLELARLLLADFDLDVVGIVGQPFQLLAEVDGRVRRHVPDYFLVRRDGSALVVNVKPAERAARPEVAAELAWPGRLVADHGWAYEVWTGVSAARLSNVRFLAGYRRSAVAPSSQEVVSAVVDGDSLRSVEVRLGGEMPPGVVRRFLLRALWDQDLRCDLDRPLDGGTVLRRAS